MSTKKLAAVAGIIGCVAGLSACYGGNQGGPRVGDIGDSITRYALTNIESSLAPTYAYQVNGVPGDTMADQLPEINTINNDPEGSPRDWVIELGTNDAWWADTNYQADYVSEINMVSRASCVILLTITPQLPTPTMQAIATTLNNDMAATVASNPSKYHLLDWGHEEFNGPWVESDNIHPNTAGDAELASLENTALQQDCT